VKLHDGCLLPIVNVLWSMHCYPKAKLWSSYYVGRLQTFTQMLGVNTLDVNLAND